MNKTDFISGAVFLAFGVLLLAVIIPWQIADPSRALISPRLMPQLCAIGIIILAIAQCIKALKENGAGKIIRFSRSELIALAGVVGLFAVALLLFALTGPLLPAIVLIVAPMLALGERRLWLLLLLPAVCITFVYVVLYVFAGSSIS